MLLRDEGPKQPMNYSQHFPSALTLQCARSPTLEVPYAYSDFEFSRSRMFELPEWELRRYATTSMGDENCSKPSLTVFRVLVNLSTSTGLPDCRTMPCRAVLGSRTVPMFAAGWATPCSPSSQIPPPIASKPVDRASGPYARSFAHYSRPARTPESSPSRRRARNVLRARIVPKYAGTIRRYCPLAYGGLLRQLQDRQRGLSTAECRRPESRARKGINIGQARKHKQDSTTTLSKVRHLHW